MGKVEIVKHFNDEERNNELARIKSYIDIGLFVVTAVQIYQEFFYNYYLDYVVMLITGIETGLFIYGYLMMYRMLARKRKLVSGSFELFTEFHNSFLTSMIVPLIFLFTKENTTFENTRIPDVEILKKSCILLIFVTIGFYRVLPMIAKKYEKIMLDGENEQLNKKCLTRVGIYLVFLYLLDIIIVASVYMLLMGMLLREEIIATLIFGLSILITYIIVFKHRITDEKKTLKRVIIGSLCLLSFVLGVVGTYNIYLVKNVREYEIPSGKYHCSMPHRVAGNVDLYCSFDESIMKYCITYTNEEGEMQFDGVYECEYKAILPANGILRWYDIDGKSYISKGVLENGETPIVIEVINEALKLSEGCPYEEFLSNENYSHKGDNGREREWLFFEEECLHMRGETLEKVEAFPTKIVDLIS